MLFECDTVRDDANLRSRVDGVRDERQQIAWGLRLEHEGRKKSHIRLPGR